MKIDPKEYRVEVWDDKVFGYVELDNVLDINVIEQTLYRGSEIIERMGTITVDCIIDDKVKLLFGNDDHFRFKKRTWGNDRIRLYPCDPDKNTVCKDRTHCFYKTMNINGECKETKYREFRREE